MLRSIFFSCRRWYGNVGRTSVSWLQHVELTDDDKLNEVVVVGWLRSVRRQKKLTFMSIDDGSCSTPLQIVMPTSNVPEKIQLGCCVRAEGDLHASRGRGQATELKGSFITLLGSNPTEIHPLGDGRLVDKVTARQHPHLRPLLPTFGALYRLRHRLESAVRNTYDSAGFFHVHTPLLTKADCEGAGETLTINGGETFFSHHENQSVKTPGEAVHLTVSSQLHLEAMTSGLGQVYTLSPAWRGEKSMTRHHLSEFYMLEGESIDLDSEDAICEHVEKMMHDSVKEFLNRSDTILHDLKLVDEHFHIDDIIQESSYDRIQRFINTPFVRMTFAEALQILISNESNFTDSVTPDTIDFGKEHERFLSAHVGNKPIFITGFPAIAKPFYCALHGNDSTAQAVDLLLPEVGEVMGGSVREVNYDTLKARMLSSGGEQFVANMQWYLDLRKYGGPPHGGYGIGFDRFLQFLCGIQNIKDAVPFPRFYGSCRV